MDNKYGANTPLVLAFLEALRSTKPLDRTGVAVRWNYTKLWQAARTIAENHSLTLGILPDLETDCEEVVELWVSDGHAPMAYRSAIIGAVIALAVIERLESEVFSELYSPFKLVVPFQTLKGEHPDDPRSA